MNNLAERLVWLGFTPGTDFMVQDDGEGPYIAQWLSEEPQPDGEELENAELSFSNLAAHVAQKRWEIETGGITLNGMSVFTDDRSKSLILGARLAAESDSEFTTEWKGADGTFVTIDAPTIIAVSNAILEHVRKCFATEAAVIADIESGAITTVEEIDDAFNNQ